MIAGASALMVVDKGGDCFLQCATVDMPNEVYDVAATLAAAAVPNLLSGVDGEPVDAAAYGTGPDKFSTDALEVDIPTGQHILDADRSGAI